MILPHSPFTPRNNTNNVDDFYHTPRNNTNTVDDFATLSLTLTPHDNTNTVKILFFITLPWLSPGSPLAPHVNTNIVNDFPTLLITILIL